MKVLALDEERVRRDKAEQEGAKVTNEIVVGTIGGKDGAENIVPGGTKIATEDETKVTVTITIVKVKARIIFVVAVGAKGDILFTIDGITAGSRRVRVRDTNHGIILIEDGWFQEDRGLLGSLKFCDGGHGDG